jgi:hypothetical protein
MPLSLSEYQFIDILLTAILETETVVTEKFMGQKILLLKIKQFSCHFNKGFELKLF